MSELLRPFTPTAGVALAAALAGLSVGLGSGAVAAWARRRGVATHDTRKIFHFLVFSGAVGVHLAWHTAGTAVFGSVVAALVCLAVARGAGDPLFEALARPGDAPKRGTFVLVPLFATAAGGLVSNLLFGDLAVVGYLVTGWGDAVGEPVGVRWGRHPYRVPSLGGVPARRSVEGSAAVFFVGGCAAWLALEALGVHGGRAVAVAVACASVAVCVEAISHHGLDNLTLQVAVSWTAAALLTG